MWERKFIVWSSEANSQTAETKSYKCLFSWWRLIKLKPLNAPSERSLRLLRRTLVWLHWSLCSRWDLRRGSAPDPPCPAQQSTVSTWAALSESRCQRCLTQMARFTLFPVMFSFFVRKDACRGRRGHDYCNRYQIKWKCCCLELFKMLNKMH